MIPVPSPATIRQLDQLTVERQGITFEELMERAGTAVTTWLLEKFPEQKEYTIFCGYGNNGGDGLVIARQLAERSKNVTVFLLEGAGKATEAFSLNLQRLKEQLKARIIPITTIEQLELPQAGEIVVEAIFGNGINREPEGLSLEVIRGLNTSTNTVVSIDVPGGLLPNEVTAADKCIHADYTLAFQFPRLPFFFPETGNLCGNWVLLNIQLEEDPQVVAGDKIFMTEPADLAHWNKPRNKFSYKNNFGHALLLAGSKGKCGAAFLAARACLRSGAGLVTVRASQTCSHVLQTSLPEAMVSEDEGKDFLEVPLFPLEYAAIGMGPGIGTDKATGNVLKRLLQDYKGPVVLDADALNLLADNKTWLAFLQPETILTPHPGEFKRLAGEEKNPFLRLQLQKELSKKHHLYIVLKGRYTMISCPDGTVIVNPTGNPGMSTAGSGDALTGMITAFRAQGYSALAAAVSGVYLHGVAGDKAAVESGENGLIATDIINQIPLAIRDTISNFSSE